MDPLTHTLVGVALGRAGLAQRHGRGTTLLLALASNAPDVDFVVHFTHGQDGAFMRRSFTHGVLGVPLLALVLAALFRTRMKGTSFAKLFLLGLLAMGVHVFFDLVNSYGVVPLWPFSHARVELAWVFIIDLTVWGILVAPVLLVLTPLRRAGTLPFRLCLVLLAAYVLTCATGRHHACGMLREQVRAEGLAAEWTYVFPEALGPQRWRGVARTGDTYRSWLLHVVGGHVESMDDVTTDLRDAKVAAARDTSRGRRLEWFFKAPVWRREETTCEVAVFDLRFQSAVLRRRGTPFVYHVAVPGCEEEPP